MSEGVTAADDQSAVDKISESDELSVLQEKQFEPSLKSEVDAQKRLNMLISAWELGLGDMAIARGIMSSSDLSTLAPLFAICRYSAGEIIMSQGEPATSCAISLTGTMTLTSEDVVVHLSSGSVAGANHYFEASVRAATLTADTDVWLAICSFSDFPAFSRASAANQQALQLLTKLFGSVCLALERHNPDLARVMVKSSDLPAGGGADDQKQSEPPSVAISPPATPYSSSKEPGTGTAKKQAAQIKKLKEELSRSTAALQQSKQEVEELTKKGRKQSADTRKANASYNDLVMEQSRQQEEIQSIQDQLHAEQAKTKELSGQVTELKKKVADGSKDGEKKIKEQEKAIATLTEKVDFVEFQNKKLTETVAYHKNKLYQAQDEHAATENNMRKLRVAKDNLELARKTILGKYDSACLVVHHLFRTAVVAHFVQGMRIRRMLITMYQEITRIHREVYSLLPPKPTSSDTQTELVRRHHNICLYLKKQKNSHTVATKVFDEYMLSLEHMDHFLDYHKKKNALRAQLEGRVFQLTNELKEARQTVATSQVMVKQSIQKEQAHVEQVERLQQDKAALQEEISRTHQLVHKEEKDLSRMAAWCLRRNDSPRFHVEPKMHSDHKSSFPSIPGSKGLPEHLPLDKLKERLVAKNKNKKGRSPQHRVSNNANVPNTTPVDQALQNGWNIKLDPEALPSSVTSYVQDEPTGMTVKSRTPITMSIAGTGKPEFMYLGEGW